ncbi:MAG: superoxide dismutase [Cu-Zn] SodC [Pigmentiphaga sp.]|nr:superoxide dismutase [Cu-Zn] SodC [Pigmentiphaga sp.]
MPRLSLCVAGLSLAFSQAVWADVTVNMATVNAQGKVQDIGSVTISETRYGLVFTPDLKGLSPGLHGFHVHEKPSCDPGEQNGKPVAALGAGGHLDPQKSGKHGLPWDESAHLGDLPALFVQADGSASYPVLAPRLNKLDLIKDRSLMVHEGGDNHADHPAPLGGGGPRMACGVIGG